MKTLKSIVPVVLLVIIFSCGDDDPKKQTFTLDHFLALAGFDEEVEDNVDAGDYEFGLRFKPKADGSITEIMAMLPDDRTDLRVTIWDAETQDDLRTETIASVTADVLASQEISPLALEKDHEYMITFNSNDWYNRYRTDEEDVTYPINVGTISITGYGYVSGTAQTYPVSFENDYYAGDLSFVFEAD